VLFIYWIAWSFALWLLVYINASRLESHSKACGPLTGKSAETQLRHVGGDDGIDRHILKKIDRLSTTGRMSSTVIRKQFHVVAVAAFVPALLSDINVLRMAVGCSLVVFVMLEVGIIIII